MRIEVIVHKDCENSKALTDLLPLIPKNTLFTHYFTRSRVITRELIKPSDNKKGIYLDCEMKDAQDFYRRLYKNGFTLVASRIHPEAKVKKD
ncbi:MAG: hypothetical protein ABH840_03945 [Nanoarchaeota archaeon]